MTSEQPTDESQQSTDPLDGADVGETKTVRDTVELHAIDFEPDVFWGDRIGSSEIENVDVVEDEYGDQKLVVTFEGELTKALPRRWDSYREPVTDAEEAAQRRRKWEKNAARAVAVVAPLGLALFITNHVMQQMTGITINGEPMQPPSPEMFAVIIGLALFFMWALQRLPGRIGGRA